MQKRPDETGLRQFDLNLLPVFAALMRERSVTRAGQALFLSQPATSAALARLRAAFRDELLIRNGKLLEATPRAEALMAALVLTLAAAPLAWSSLAQARAAGAQVPRFDAPDVLGWSKDATGEGSRWTPRFAGADRLVVQRYRDAAGRTVELAVAAYAAQAEGRELVGFGQGATPPGSGWSWSQALTPPPGGRADLTAPPEVIRATQLMFLRVAIGLISAIITFASGDAIKTSIRDRDPSLTTDQVNSAYAVGVAVAIVFGVIFAALYILLAIQVRKGKNWARILGTVFAALSILSYLFGMLGALMYGGLGIVLIVIALIALIVDIQWIVNAFKAPNSAYFAQNSRR